MLKGIHGKRKVGNTWFSGMLIVTPPSKKFYTEQMFVLDF